MNDTATAPTSTDTGTSAPTGNPLLTREGYPLFDRIEPEHVQPAVRHVLTEANARLDELEPRLAPSWAELVAPLEELDRPFEYAWSPVSHLLAVKNSPELRQAYDSVLADVVSFGLRFKQSEPIYRALKELRASDEWESLAEAQRRIVTDKLREAELAGIGLTGDKRTRFNEIEQELSQLSTDFTNHLLDAIKAYALILTFPEEVEGLADSALQLAAQSYNRATPEASPQATPEDGPWRITLDMPSYRPFMEHAKRRDLREKIYRAFIARASEGEYDNTGLIPKILKLRQERAALLGYRTFADLSLATKMAPDVRAVQDLLEKLRAASWDAAVQDLEDIQQLAAKSGCTEPLKHWDIAFWAERLREERFDYTDEELRPYFPLPRVLDGLFGLVEKLFGVTVKPADGDAPVWNEDVRFFRIEDRDGSPLAAFYLDPYSRPENKRGGAWMNDCFGRQRIDGKIRLPVAHLVCNSTPPVGERPSLMTFDEVNTLFHEFGHGLQHMLTTVDFADAAGINGVEWDAVELPSQFMENWCYHKPTLVGMTAHIETGEPLPDELFEKILAARTYRAGSNMLRQLSFGSIDMELHHNYDPDGEETVFDVQRRVAQTTSVLPPLPEDRFLCGFQHIFTNAYAAGYYSYKWAEVLSADAYSAFEEVGLDNEAAIAKMGQRFRETVLGLGGGRHPMDVFKDFRGRESSPEALLRHNDLLGNPAR